MTMSCEDDFEIVMKAAIQEVSIQLQSIKQTLCEKPSSETLSTAPATRKSTFHETESQNRSFFADPEFPNTKISNKILNTEILNTQPSNSNTSNTQNKSQTFERLYQHAKEKKQRGLKECEKRRMMEDSLQMQDCTFTPTIKHKNPNTARPKTVPNGYNAAVSRLRMATEKRKQEVKAAEKIPNGENYEKIRKAKVSPFSFQEGYYKVVLKPKLFEMNVQISVSKRVCLVVRVDDDPRQVVHNFAKSYALKQNEEKHLLKGLISEMVKRNLINVVRG